MLFFQIILITMFLIFQITLCEDLNIDDSRVTEAVEVFNSN